MSLSVDEAVLIVVVTVHVVVDLSWDHPIWGHPSMVGQRDEYHIDLEGPSTLVLDFLVCGVFVFPSFVGRHRNTPVPGVSAKSSADVDPYPRL